MDQIAERIGNWNHAANRVAIGELAARGLLVIEKTHPKGSRLSDEYRLTYVNTGDAKQKVEATNDYRHWKIGDAGTVKKRLPPTQLGNKSLVTTATRNGPSVATIEDDGKLSVSTIETLQAQNTPCSVSTVATHIIYQDTASDADVSPIEETSRRPRSIPEDRWAFAGRRAEVNPAGPGPAELRQRAAEHIEQFGRGSQGRLANAAGILAGTMSKFLNGDVDLTNRHRVALASVMPKVAAAEERMKPRQALNGARQ